MTPDHRMTPHHRTTPDLTPLPLLPAEVPWPAADWPRGDVPEGADLGRLLDRAFADPGRAAMGTTLAVVVIHRGRLVAERYGGQIEHFDRPPDPVCPETTLLSWSMAKSVLHAAVGILVGEQRLELGVAAPVPEWQGPADPRSAITLEQLLEMRDGLGFVEDYVDAETSSVIEMLFGSGQSDVVSYAAGTPLAAPPGERFNYSSGTSNIISGIVSRAISPEPIDKWLHRRLFDRIGMTSVELGLDAAGNWVASSYLHATAKDFARFGLLYLRDGVWDGSRLLPEGWVDHGRRPRSVDPDGSLYGAHWWVVDDEHGTWRASGYEGQAIVISPALDLVVVRLGKTAAEQAEALRRWLADVVDAFAATST